MNIENGANQFRTDWHTAARERATFRNLKSKAMIGMTTAQSRDLTRSWERAVDALNERPDAAALERSEVLSIVSKAAGAVNPGPLVVSAFEETLERHGGLAGFYAPAEPAGSA